MWQPRSLAPYTVQRLWLMSWHYIIYHCCSKRQIKDKKQYTPHGNYTPLMFVQTPAHSTSPRTSAHLPNEVCFASHHQPPSEKGVCYGNCSNRASNENASTTLPHAMTDPSLTKRPLSATGANKVANWLSPGAQWRASNCRATPSCRVLEIAL